MEWYHYSAVMGTVMFAYIQMFNRNMQMYKESGYTLTWGNFIDQSVS